MSARVSFPISAEEVMLLRAALARTTFGKSMMDRERIVLLRRLEDFYPTATRAAESERHELAMGAIRAPKV